MLNAKLKTFFATHPAAAVVFVALGTLFTDQAKAQSYLAGTDPKNKVETYSREEVAQMDAPTLTIGDDTETKDLIEDTPHRVTADDLVLNPELVANGIKEGDLIGLPDDPQGPLTETELVNMITEQNVILEQKYKALDDAKNDEEKKTAQAEVDKEYQTVIDLEKALNDLTKSKSDKPAEYIATSEAENYGNEPSVTK